VRKRANRQEILGFIGNFKDAQNTFLFGCCYWFAFILSKRFGGVTMYLPVENHFIQEIGGLLYDVSGDVTAQYTGSQIIPWDSMEEYDSSLYHRIIRDCVNKENRKEINMAKFDVTVVRIGSLSIEADTAEEAMRLSEGYGNDDVVWADWFEATDAQREGGSD
jgi:hypothetical protein